MNNTIVLEPGGRQNSGRIPSLDIVRGVAILGTLWTNIWLFTNPNGLFGALTATGPQSLAERLLAALSQGKFLALLSLIFGVGLALQFRSAVRCGRRWPGTYRRRMLLLLIDGALNYILIAEFDVLMGYAFTGFVVSYLVLTSARTQRTLMITLGAAHVLLISWIAWAVHYLPAASTEIATPYASGSFLDLVVFRLDHVVMFRGEMMIIFLLSIVMFLLGARLYYAGVFEPHAANLRKKLLIIGAAALPIDIAFGLTGNTSLVLIERYVLAPWVCLGILAVIVELCLKFGTDSLPARLLRDVGRTALSCYLLQNLLGGLLFYGWGFGLVAHIQSWRVPATMAGYLVIAACVVAFAHLWLRRFPTGPVEWLWKKLAGT